MVTGLVLIAFGVLVALVPQILVILVSTILISTGTALCLLSWRWKRLRRSSNASQASWIIRW